LEQSFEVVVDRDFALLGIDSPSLNYLYQTKQGMFPRVRMSNLGKDSSLKNGKIFMQVTSMNNQQVWYRDTVVFGEILPGDSSWIVFNKRLEFIEIGLHKVKVNLMNSCDLIPENDTLNSGFIVQINSTNQFAVQKGVEVTPNPAKDKIRIQSKSFIRAYRFVDPLGRIVAEHKINQLNQSNLIETKLPMNQGGQMYYLIVDTDKGSVSCVIFVEQ